MPQVLFSLNELFTRDLKKLIKELNSYKDEHDLWLLKGEIRNCAGNLAWHIIGNLNHFIGATLGGSGYIRDRNGEFNDKSIPREKLVNKIEEAIQIVNKVLPSLTEDQLQSTYPIEVFGKPMTTTFFLIHLHSHLNYHLGQINYHRRLVSVN